MSIVVEFTDEFENWWNTLTEIEQDRIDGIVGLLEQRGPILSHPYSKVIKSSRYHPDMRELRVNIPNGRKIRIFYAVTPVDMQSF